MTQQSAGASNWIEKYIVYGFINLIGYVNHLASRIFRKVQTGLVHHYAAIIIGGMVLLIHLFLWWSGRLQFLNFISSR